MIGGIYLKKGGGQEQRISFCGTEILCLPLSPRSRSSARRLARAEKRLRQAGCRRLLLGEDIDPARLPGKLLLASPLPLRRHMAVETGLHLLREREIPNITATAVLVAEYPTPQLCRQAVELSCRMRYLVLALRRGGEGLCLQLQRQLGVAARLLPPGESIPAELILLYENCPGWEKQGAVCLPLYGETEVLWPVEYGLEEEKSALFSCFEREKLLSALLEMGVLREKDVKIRTKWQNT